MVEKSGRKSYVMVNRTPAEIMLETNNLGLKCA